MARKKFLWWIFPLLGILIPGIAANKNPARKTAEEDFIRIFLCGDVMTGRGIDQILPNPVDPELRESYLKSATGYVRLAENAGGNIRYPVEPRYIWGTALKYWKDLAPDRKIINLETSITTSDEWWPGKAVNYRMHPEHVEVLTAAGIDYCAVANNHLLDFGRTGMDETLITLNKAGIASSGAGKDLGQAMQPAILKEAGNTRIVVFSVGMMSSGIPRAWAATESRSGIYVPESEKKLLEHIRRFNDNTSLPGDIIVVSIHWGSNWGYEIPFEQQELAHRLIDEAGVDVVHGHSSHHFKGLEVYKNKLVIYGAGDFINDYEGIGGHEIYKGEISLMYFPDIGLQQKDLEGLIIVPLMVKNMRLNDISADDAQWVLDVLNLESEKFNTSFRMVHKNRIEWIKNP
jgi:poly-gamma-glutamate capsule biosynthesis protein CapA/YwtB (metallophosphatase superfamily)